MKKKEGEGKGRAEDLSPSTQRSLLVIDQITECLLDLIGGPQH